ncbi:dTDP-4-dehydrorhamnose 3,5-epimerase [candidate division KSB1 bacterium]|nr:dTDP-4-dehydrorhamnose 3,5-epimerase [candidate division KSB1 bacterium]
MPFEFRTLNIPDLILIEPRTFPDARGFFMETYQKTAFADNGIPELFVQDNLSHSSKGTLRGLHYQLDPCAQGKLVTCLTGEVYDVAVDLREGSPWFKQWIGIYLSYVKPQMLYIPPGFAHGFCVLSSEADFVYKVTGEYAPAQERGINWNDPEIGIDWPIENPILSERDEALPVFRQADFNFTYNHK